MKQNQVKKVILIILTGLIACATGAFFVTFIRMPQTTGIRILETVCFLLCLSSLWGTARLGNLLKRRTR